MAKTVRQDDEPTRSRRVRIALVPIGRAAAATTACILWGGLALPGLQLLPGTGGFGHQSISISLQSALLGIDDGLHGSTPGLRAAMQALGLAVTRQSAPPRLRSSSGSGPSLAVQVADSVRVDTPASSAEARTEGREDAVPDRTAPAHPPVDPAVPAASGEPSPKPANGGVGGAGGAPQAPPPAPAPAKLEQSITFTTAPAAAVVGGSYSVGASASSGLPVSLSEGPGSAGVCTVSGLTVALVGPGTCTIRANQAGNGSYFPAPQVTQPFAVAAAVAAQTISFTSTPPSGALVGHSPYHVTANATSGLPVEFGVDSPQVCQVTGAHVTFVGAGICTINATQRGNSSYHPAPQVHQSFSVGSEPPKSVQSISFSSSSPTGATAGGTSYTVSAAASSGLPVAFSAGAGSSGVCIVSGSTVTLVGAGTCTIDADQAGDANYLAAPQVHQSFTIAQGMQTITFPDPGNFDKTDPPFVLSATASSGLAVTYTLDPTSTPFCSLSGNVVTPIDRGDCIVYANQPGDANYLAASQVSIVIRIKNHTPGGGG